MFGIINRRIGFRQFLLRWDFDRVRGEWSLVTMAWNIKTMYALSLGLSQRSPSAALEPRRGCRKNGSSTFQVD